MAPPGLRAVIYLDPDNRAAWGARGLDAWYCGPDFDHYRCCSFYVPETRAYRTPASFHLFPQHCSLSEFLPGQHATEVYNELKESIQQLNAPNKQKISDKLATTLRECATDNPLQRVGISPTPEGEPSVQRAAAAPPITTSQNPTAPRTLHEKPRSHQRKTRNNIPGAVPAIIIPPTEKRTLLRFHPNRDPLGIIKTTPNSTRIPMAWVNIVSSEAVIFLTARIYSEVDETWLPNNFIVAQPAQRNHDGTNIGDVDIEHFCDPVIHPVTGETITSYKNWQTTR